MLVFAAVLLMLNHSYTMFTPVLHSDPNVNLPIHAAKYKLKIHFLYFFIALALFGPTPQITYSNFGQYITSSWLISVNIATCMYITLVGPACTLSK